MTKTLIDFNNGKELSIEENKSDIVITLNKDMINHVKFVFEDSGIPGIVGPHLYMNAKDIVEKYLKECKNERI